MKKNTLIMMLTIFCFAKQLSAQLTFQKTIGGTGHDDGLQIQKTADKGYILTGRTNSFGAGGDDVYLIKLNTLGDTLWTRTYGGSNDEYGTSVKQAPDGGYIITGYSTSFGASGKDIYLLKTDSTGNVSWSELFGGSGDDYGNAVLVTSDSGYLIAGASQDPITGNYDARLIKTDANGDTLWTRSYGGSLNDDGYSVQQTADNGFILTGVTESFGAGNEDVYIVKTKANGDTLWTKTYGGSLNDIGYSINQTTDGGYILTGTTNSFGAGSYDCFLMKTDSNGIALWTKTYGGVAFDNGYSVLQTDDGGFIVLGQSYSFGVNSDVHLIKTDALGNVSWTKRYGGNGYDYEGSILKTDDEGYLICGSEQSFGSNRDIYLIKTDSAGLSYCHEGSTATIVSSASMSASVTTTAVSSGESILTAATLMGGGASVNNMCSSVGTNDAELAYSVTVFPNPFLNQLTIRLSDNEPTTIYVYDLPGHLILQQTLAGSTTLNTSQLADGLYFYELRNSKGMFKTGKVIK